MVRGLIVIVFSFLYLQISFTQNFAQSNLPLIIINTQGKSISDEPKITALMQVINNPNRVNKLSDTNFEYEGYIGIEKRGNTSQYFFDKKSYALETRTDSGTNRNVSLLGLPKENDWVLYGPFSDKSLIRNVLAYHLGNSQGRWSPRTQYCEVFLNNEYRGIYVLTEKIKIDKNRVNIARLKPEDITGDELTGGYILRVDRLQHGSWISPFKGWTNTSDEPISYYYPKYDNLNAPQRTYIKDYVTEFEYALHGNDFKDPENGYRAYIDVISFIDYYIMTELSRDLDGYRCSIYFHKDKDSKGGKLVMSPMWDYNLGFGNGNFMDANKTNGWVVEGIGSGDGYEPVFWFEKLKKDPYYNTLLKYRWEELRDKAFSDENINKFIDSCANVLADAQQRNFEKFDILDNFVWPNSYIGGTYNNEISYLENWIGDRLSWLDSQFDLIVPSTIPMIADNSIAEGTQIIVYPNPFTEKVRFLFDLAQHAKVEIIIGDVLGRVVMKQSKICNAGNNEFIFSADEFGLNDKLYFYTLVVEGENVQTGKLLRSL